jgi:hypothetical protein
VIKISTERGFSNGTPCGEWNLRNQALNAKNSNSINPINSAKKKTKEYQNPQLMKSKCHKRYENPRPIVMNVKN